MKKNGKKTYWFFNPVGLEIECRNLNIFMHYYLKKKQE